MPQLDIQFEQDDVRTPKAGVVDIDWNNPQDIADLKAYLWENKTYKRRVEEQAIRNLSYVLGDQHFKLNRRTMVMEPDRSRPDWKVELTANVILAALLKKLARIQGADVEWGAAPITDDEPDKAVARMQRDLAKYYYSRGFKMPAQMVRVQMLAMMTKVAYIECNWNPLGGQKKIVTPDQFAIPNPLTGELDMDSAFVMFGQQFGAGALERGWKTQFSGDMMLEVFPLFEMIAYPFTEPNFDQKFIKMRTRLRHITQAARIAGMSVEDLKDAMGSNPIAGDEDGPWQDRVTGWGASTFQELGAARATKSLNGPDHELVYCHDITLESWYDPENYPDGMTALVINDYCVPDSVKPIPTPNKRAPYWVVHEIPIELTEFGTCTVDQMRSGQDDLNDILTQGANYRRRQVSPTICTFGGFANGVKSFNNAPGAVQEFDTPEYMPRILERPDLPSDYERCMTATLRLLDTVSGTSDVDRGQTDLTKAASGRAITALQAANDAIVSPMVKQLRNTLAEICEFNMECLQEFAVDDRITEIIGDNNKGELRIWNREMLRPQTWGQPGLRTAMVRITGDGGMPATRDEIMEYILRFTEMGYFQPGRDDEKIFKLLGVAEIKGVLDADRVDSVAECLAIDTYRKGGIPPMPRETADFRTRLNILGKWMNDDDDYGEVTRRFPHLIGQIAQRLQLLKQGYYNREVEKRYLEMQADINMRNKFLAQGVQAAMDPQTGEVNEQMLGLVQAAFGMPMGMQAAAPQEGGGNGGPDQNA